MTIDEQMRAFTEGTEMTLKQGRDAFDMIGSWIAAALAQGHEVSLPGVGKFIVKDVPARTGRNPRTGEEVQIPATRKVILRVAKSLKSAL